LQIAKIPNIYYFAMCNKNQRFTSQEAQTFTLLHIAKNTKPAMFCDVQQDLLVGFVGEVNGA
jgi:hypothetical protein